MRVIVEILKIEAKKDGIDRLYKLTLQTDDPSVLELQRYIAEKTVEIDFKA